MTNLKSTRIKKLVEVSQKYKIDSNYGYGVPFPQLVSYRVSAGTAPLMNFAGSLLQGSAKEIFTEQMSDAEYPYYGEEA